MNELERELQETEDKIDYYENRLALLEDGDEEQEKQINEALEHLRSYAERLEKRLYGFEPDFK